MDESDMPELDEAELAEAIDPDWPDHFIDAYDCVAHYRRLCPEIVAQCIKELQT